MRKNTKRLMTIMAASVMALSGGFSAALMQAPAAVSAARVAKQRKRKMARRAIAIKRGAKVYVLHLNKKQNKVVKATLLKRGKRAFRIRGGLAGAIWSVRVGKHLYYYIGNNKKGQMLAIRSNSVAKHGKIMSLKAYMKAYAKKANKEIKIPVKHVSLASVSIPGSVTSASIYAVVGKDNKVTAAQDKIPVGSSVQVLFLVPQVFSQGSTQLDGYYAIYNNQAVILPAKNVNVNGAQVPDHDSFIKNLEAKDKAYVIKQVKKYQKEHHLARK